MSKEDFCAKSMKIGVQAGSWAMAQALSANNGVFSEAIYESELLKAFVKFNPYLSGVDLKKLMN